MKKRLNIEIWILYTLLVGIMMGFLSHSVSAQSPGDKQTVVAATINVRAKETKTPDVYDQVYNPPNGWTVITHRIKVNGKFGNASGPNVTQVASGLKFISQQNLDDFNKSMQHFFSETEAKASAEGKPLVEAYSKLKQDWENSFEQRIRILNSFSTNIGGLHITARAQASWRDTPFGPIWGQGANVDAVVEADLVFVGTSSEVSNITNNIRQQVLNLTSNTSGGSGSSSLSGYYKIVARHSGKVLDVTCPTGNCAGNGVKIQQYEYVGQKNQQWKLEPVGDGYYEIVARHSGKVLDVTCPTGNCAGNEVEIQQYEYVGQKNQQWKLEPVGDGYYKIVARHSGKVLDVYCPTGNCAGNGVKIQQYEYVGGTNQQWKLERVE